MNIEGPFKKLLENNSKLEDQSLTIGNENTLKSLLDKISQSQFYHSSTFTEAELKLLLKLSKWPLDLLIPFLDTLRMFFVHPASHVLFTSNKYSCEEIYSKLIEVLKNGIDTQKILVLRILNNLFIRDLTKVYMIKKRQDVLDNASVYLDSENNNIRSAVVSLLFKYNKS
jgi:hypothetical protein